MAHPYTTRARTERAINDPVRLASLLDEDQDGAEFAERYTDLIERAANLVDADLAIRYVVPFAAVTDSPPCHGIVSDLTDLAALSMLYPLTSEEAEKYAAQYRGLVDRIRLRQSSIPGAEEVSSEQSTVGATIAYSEPSLSGSTSSGTRRTRGLF